VIGRTIADQYGLNHRISTATAVEQRRSSPWRSSTCSRGGANRIAAVVARCPRSERGARPGNRLNDAAVGRLRGPRTDLNFVNQPAGYATAGAAVQTARFALFIDGPDNGTSVCCWRAEGCAIARY